MFTLTLSNRFEDLLQAMLDRLQRQQAPVLAPVQLVVPNSAVRRAIELAIARRDGVCANLQSAYLAQWLWANIGRVVPVAQTSPFSPPVLQWRVLEALSDPAFVAPHPRLLAYLADGEPRKAFELAQRVAQLFDVYITYRPAWLDDWAGGRRAALGGAGAAAADPQLLADEAWQAALWRRLLEALGTARQHPSVAFFRALETGQQLSPLTGPLPSAVQVFGLPALPPLYLDMLRSLSRFTDVHYYALNPCREYWFEIIDPHRLGYLRAQRRADYHEVGHPLLAAWGRQTQGHIDSLLSDTGVIVEQGSVFVSAPAAHQLARLQNSILDLADPSSTPLWPAADDRSIEVHVCHSPSRELQVLQDQLLAAFAEDSTLQPADVVVLVPDLDTLAPQIDAVFGATPPARRIPYAITGRPTRAVNLVGRALESLLALLEGRFAASEVFELLEMPPVARRFALSADDLALVHDWLGQAGIRWALDGRQRGAAGLPDDPSFSFADGLSRLFLAYAVGDAPAQFGQRASAGNPEGQDSLVLGRLRLFVDRLCACRDSWQLPSDADGWRDRLMSAVAALIAPAPEWLDQYREVEAAIGQFHRQLRDARYTGLFDAAVARLALTQALEASAHGGVPTGAVTFASLSSLRGLPYRMVCLLGFGDGRFPATDKPAEFDLLARFAQRGDRQRRVDERNLFLDAVLAARDRLLVTYTGRSIRDNQPMPPSVLVDELLEFLERMAAGSGASSDQRAALRRQLVVEQPLTPFSPQAFVADPARQDPRHHSFHQEYAQALTARQRLQAAMRARRDALPLFADAPGLAADDAADNGVTGDDEGDDGVDGQDEQDNAINTAPVAMPFFDGPLADPEPPARQVDLDQLARFLRNPCQALLQRLGVAIASVPVELVDDEPFVLGRRERRALADRLLPAALAGADAAALARRALAGTELPRGSLGGTLLAREVERQLAFAGRLAPALAAPVLASQRLSLPVQLAGQSWQLDAVVDGLRADGLVHYRNDDPSVYDYLQVWLQHLALCVIKPDGVACVSRWLGPAQAFRFDPVPDSASRLAELMALYRQGLCAPLPFFPRSSWAFVAHESSMQQARKEWLGSDRVGTGESRHAAYRLALRGRPDPLDQAFIDTSRRVLAPLLAALLPG